MARVPEIASTAARSAIPSAGYAPRSASAADFGGQIGAAVQDAGTALEGAARSYEGLELARAADQKRLRDFTLQTNFVKFSSEEATRLQEAQRDIQPGGWEFQKTFVMTHAERADQWLTENGVTDPQEKGRWQTQMAQLGGQLSQTALGSEFQERTRFYATEVDNTLDLFKTGIDQAPDQFDSYLEQGNSVIDQSGLPPSVKDAAKDRWARTAATAYGTALVARDPSAAMSALGGPVTEAGDYSGPTGEAKGDFDFFRSKGLSGVAAAAVVGVLSWESGGGLAGINPNGRNRGDGNDGSDSIGAGQWNAERATALKSFAQARGKNWNDKGVQLEFVMHEFQTTEPEAYRRLQAATTIEQAVEAMSYYERPQGWRNGGDPTKVIHFAQRVERAKHFAGPVATETRPAEGAVDPRLALLPYDARQQLMGAAARTIQQQTQQAAAAAQTAQASQVNSLELNLLDGKAGIEDIQAARDAGWLSDASDVNRLTNIVEAKAEKNSDLNAFATAWANPEFQWNPYDTDQRKAVDAAYAANEQGLGALQGIVDRTGIVPPSAATQLRGSLLSNDPTRVGQAAALASNIMARQPNAFTAIEGGKDIEQAAVMRDYYLNTLGLSAEQAGQRLAADNDPERQNQMRPDEKRRSDFEKTMRERVNPGAIVNALPGPNGRVLTPAQGQAIAQDYMEIAADNFRRYGDQGAAFNAAQREVNRLYGISSNGTFTKYPPEKIYPADAQGTHNYIYEQAAARVNANARGVSGVDPRSVFLLPLPTVTAEAWRQGQPPAYAIGYVREVDGQKVYDVLPGGYRFNPPARAPSRTDTQAATDVRRARELATFRQNAIGAMVP